MAVVRRTFSVLAGSMDENKPSVRGGLVVRIVVGGVWSITDAVRPCFEYPFCAGRESATPKGRDELAAGSLGGLGTKGAASGFGR